jgi:hypothetical protein
MVYAYSCKQTTKGHTMRIHSDHLDAREVQKAATLAGVGFTRFSLHGSRSRAGAFDVILTGASPRNQNGGSDKAATWDQWGVFLSTLFAVDPKMVTPYYADAEHFHWSTGNRYAEFNLADDHVKGHKWEFSGDSAGGGYMVHECACGAIRRFIHRGTWAEFVAAHA